MQITKSVNGEPNEKRSSDTMGQKHFVRFGLYEIKGSINVQLAEKTGFTEEDAEVVKECLRTLFVNDASSARPDGSMEVIKLFWFKHNCKDGQYSSAKIHRSIKIALKDEEKIPSSVEDYMITIEELKFDKDGLIPAVVVDAVTKQVLTVAYMNRESLAISMEKGLTCFWSRSRQELWLKGETSGNYQRIVSITADCDKDALTVVVEKAGPA